MAVEVKRFGSSEQSALDGLLGHHLSLDPQHQDDHGNTENLNTSWNGTDPNSSQSLNKSLSSTTATNRKEASRQFSRPSVHQNTLESDNKRRPIVLKRNASRYKSPSPEPLDPNSEAKSMTIRRMQNSLEDWDKQLEDISVKKAKNESLQLAELTQRDNQIKDLSDKYLKECEVRAEVEIERDTLTQQLSNIDIEFAATKAQVEQLQSDLTRYETAYEEIDSRRIELEEQIAESNEQLQQSETMRRRLNDNVTELQGQLAIEEQRSKFCNVM